MKGKEFKAQILELLENLSDDADVSMGFVEMGDHVVSEVVRIETDQNGNVKFCDPYYMG